MSIHRDKYQEAILFFVRECNNTRLGKTKLMKLLYYLDFDHFEEHGSSVTGDIYKKLPYGPVPGKASFMLATLEKEGLLVRSKRVTGSFEREHYSPQGDPNLDVFTESELATLRAVASRWRHASRNEIVEATHNEAPWIAVKDGSVVPYAYAHYRNNFGQLDEPDVDEDPVMVDELLANDARD